MDYTAMAPFEVDVDNCCIDCQNKNSVGFNDAQKQQSVPSEILQHNYSAPSTSKGLTHDKRSLCTEDINNCAQIRNMTFVKNCYKNVPAPSEQFLAGVNCAIIKTLREIEQNHKLCAIKKRPGKHKSQN